MAIKQLKDMSSLIKEIEKAWQIKDKLLQDSSKLITLKQTLNDSIESLNQGTIRVCEKKENSWQVNEWVKKSYIAIFYHYGITTL